jgi:hypothetical protein
MPTLRHFYGARRILSFGLEKRDLNRVLDWNYFLRYSTSMLTTSPTGDPQ